MAEAGSGSAATISSVKSSGTRASRLNSARSASVSTSVRKAGDSSRRRSKSAAGRRNSAPSETASTVFGSATPPTSARSPKTSPRRRKARSVRRPPLSEKARSRPSRTMRRPLGGSPSRTTTSSRVTAAGSREAITRSITSAGRRASGELRRSRSRSCWRSTCSSSWWRRSGWSAISASKSSRSSRSASTGALARTVAVRGVPSSRPRSPKVSPG
jgi:hypothetical protein